MSAFLMAPAFLLGIFLAAIPVVIHLLYQRRAPQVRFSTIRFLKLCIRKTARRKRIENLLLLILRAALFALLAMALAKPFLKSTLTGGRGPAGTVIVLDNSYSMATKQQGVERFAVAKDLARSLVRQMSETDSVALVLTGGRREPGDAGLSHRLNEIASRIANAEIFAGRADLVAAINRAYEILDKTEDANREVVVITDLQANAFEGDLGRQAARRKDIPIFIYDCGQEAVANLAVEGLTWKGGARVGGATATITALLFNPTDREIKDARITLYVDKRPVKEGIVTVQPNARTRYAFTYPFTEAKTVTGWVQLSDDSLDVDNRYNFRLGVSDRISVLVLRDEEVGIRYLDSAFYLLRALDPGVAGDEGAVGPIRPDAKLLSDLDKLTLNNYGVVFLVNLRQLDPGAIGHLRRYVENGGTVVVFPGDAVDPRNYANVFRLDGSGLLPAKLAAAIGNAEKRDRIWRLAPPQGEARIFARLRRVPHALFESVRVYRFFPVEDLNAAKVTVLATLRSEKAMPESTPLLVSSGLGEGEVFFFSVPADTRWSNFAAAKVFVPIMHELVYAVTGKTGRLESVMAGQPRRFDVGDAKGDVTLSVEVRPGVVEVKKPEEGLAKDAIVFANTYRPGIYRYALTGGKSEEDFFVVNPDTTESELGRIDEDDLRAKLAFATLRVAQTPEELDEQRTRLREGYPLSGYVFLLVILIALVELFVANRTRPARVEASVQPGTAT